MSASSTKTSVVCIQYGAIVVRMSTKQNISDTTAMMIFAPP